MPKYAKGSPEMKQHMAKLRGMRGKGYPGENYYHPTAHDLLPASQQGKGMSKHKGICQDPVQEMGAPLSPYHKDRHHHGAHPHHNAVVEHGNGIVHVIHHHHLHGEGWTDDARNFFSGVGNQIENGFHDTIAQPIQQVVAPVKNTLNTLQDTLVNKIGKGYIAKKKGGLATDLIQYGVPALGSAVGSTLGESAGLLTGNPLLGFAGGVAGGAMGSKAGNMLANKIRNDTGTGMRRGKRLKDNFV